MRAAAARLGRRRPRPLPPIRGAASRADLQHCWDLVQRSDYEAYCCLRLAPASIQPALVAIRAFNVETAAVKTVAGENVLAGRVRIQFWRDAIEAIYGDGEAGAAQSNEPLTRALAAELPARGLTAAHFHRILDARERDLEVPPPNPKRNWLRLTLTLTVTEQPDALRDVEAYADATQSSLLYLYLELLQLDADAMRRAQRVAQNFGVAIGVATALRALPHLVPLGATGVPRDLARKHELYTRTLLQGPRTEAEGEAMAAATYDMARLAHGYLDEGVELVRELEAGPQNPKTLAPILTLRA